VKELPDLEDDGLLAPSVGRWGEQKYLHVTNYASVFATSMKAKWDCRIYVDLFAGAGRSRIDGTDRIVEGSPLLALAVVIRSIGTYSASRTAGACRHFRSARVGGTLTETCDSSSGM
jgi:hypothetical protein